MHPVELYESAKGLAEKMGYQVREENLGGIGGGACEVGGRRCIFVDIAMSSAEQLDHMILALSRDQSIYTLDIPEPLRQLFPLSRAA